jgi:hypothetical protein
MLILREMRVAAGTVFRIYTRGSFPRLFYKKTVVRSPLGWGSPLEMYRSESQWLSAPGLPPDEQMQERIRRRIDTRQWLALRPSDYRRCYPPSMR